MAAEQNIFSRTERLLGSDVMHGIASVRVIIFGIGGVGSWCAESLVRTGVRHITLVDCDSVCNTNINRQLHATSATVGLRKVEAMRNRLMEINPDAEITAIDKVYCEATADEFDLNAYDYVIDAIDSLRDKILLIRRATDSTATFFSSMGAALKIDPTQVRVAEFWKVRGCPLGAMLRKRIKQSKKLLSRKFMCVYSEELLVNRGDTDEKAEAGIPSSSTGDAQGADGRAASGESKKAQINGSLSHITAIFGFTLAGLVMQDISQRFQAQ